MIKIDINVYLSGEDHDPGISIKKQSNLIDKLRKEGFEEKRIGSIVKSARKKPRKKARPVMKEEEPLILRLCDEGLTYKEIAAIFNKSIPAIWRVWKRYRSTPKPRARKK